MTRLLVCVAAFFVIPVASASAESMTFEFDRGGGKAVATLISGSTYNFDVATDHVSDVSPRFRVAALDGDVPCPAEYSESLPVELEFSAGMLTKYPPFGPGMYSWGTAHFGSTGLGVRTLCGWAFDYNSSQAFATARQVVTIRRHRAAFGPPVMKWPTTTKAGKTTKLPVSWTDENDWADGVTFRLLAGRKKCAATAAKQTGKLVYDEPTSYAKHHVVKLKLRRGSYTLCGHITGNAENYTYARASKRVNVR
jgi:hypothetical protein